MTGTTLRLSPRTLDAILTPPRIDSFDWICEHACNKKGMPFDYLNYPWTKGICQEWDNPRRERIFFQAGSRLGKTELGMSLLECSMATAPDIAMMGGPTGDKVEQWIKDRLTPMIESCLPLRDWLPPPHRRPKDTLHLRHGTIYGAWSGSPTTLGDLDPRYLLGFEIDKFTKASSEEADSLMLLLERGAEIPNRRVYCESTPTIFGKSRIDKYVSQGTNCRFHVPCPFCGRFQQLELGRGRPGDHGLIWDHNAEGHSEPNLAYETARYRCKFCLREIDEQRRFSMVQKGTWCPQGCMVDKRGRLRGTPANDGPDASFQLSRLYGPSFTFGRYARAFVEAKNDEDPEAMRSFRNNWEGVCWQPNFNIKPWEEVAERLCCDDIQLRTMPEDGQFITTGVDVQVDHWVFVQATWTAGGRGSVINYGLAHSWEEIQQLVTTEYPHADGGPTDHSMFTLIDARDGNRTDEVTAFCRSVNHERGPWVLPCMGSKPGALHGKPFTKQQLDDQGKLTKKSNRRGLTGFHLVTVSTNLYQSWIHNCLNRREREDPSSLVFPASARYDQDLFEQLLAEVPEWTNDNCKWVKKSESTVNDFRDAVRYARCAADVYINCNWQRVARRRVLTESSRQVPGTGIPAQTKKKRNESRAGDKPRWVRRMKVR